MIDKMQFLEGIGTIANMTNTTPPEGIGLWYEKFKHWSKEDWKAACDACASELKWFPKVSEIRERKPKKYSTGAIEQASEWRLESKRTEEHLSEEIENEIDRLTDDELHWLFTQIGAADGIEFSIRMFRKHQKGEVYRKEIREAIKERNRRQVKGSTDAEKNPF
jgi:hypothetical protein